MKAKLRRAAAYLQDGTRYFSQPALLAAIVLLYRLANQHGDLPDGATCTPKELSNHGNS